MTASQTRARDGQTAAETAEAKLTASETSWKAQRETLDKEISDLKTRWVVRFTSTLVDESQCFTRCQDLISQNTILHQHLESVSSQANRIRMAAEDSSATAAGEGDASTDDTNTKLAELRSVVTYLRKEKEIVDLQLELGKQENARLKAQVDHLTQSLQEARATISEVSSFALSPTVRYLSLHRRSVNALLRVPRRLPSMPSWSNGSTN